MRRREPGQRHYFISNRSDKAFDGWLPLATPGTSVVILDPMTGHSGFAATRRVDGRVQAYVQFQPGGAPILRSIVDGDARKPTVGDGWGYLRPRGEPIAVGGMWSLDFIHGGPTIPPSPEVSAVGSWTTGSAEAARCGGTARYSTRFDAPQPVADGWRLDLGSVAHSDCVRLNGIDLGTMFMAPYQVMLPPLSPQGNQLEIEVTDVAANRIRDLDRRRVDWRIFHDINFISITGGRFDASAWPLADSGLLGPVTLHPMECMQPIR